MAERTQVIDGCSWIVSRLQRGTRVIVEVA